MTIKIYVKGCASCGSSHRMEFNAKKAINEEYPFIGICPKTSEAVNMRPETSLVK